MVVILCISCVTPSISYFCMTRIFLLVLCFVVKKNLILSEYYCTEVLCFVVKKNHLTWFSDTVWCFVVKKNHLTWFV